MAIGEKPVVADRVEVRAGRPCPSRLRLCSHSHVAGERYRPGDGGRQRRLPPPPRLRIPAVSLAVVGSIAFDSVRTPFGERERMLGGSAVHFALAARFFSEVHVVGPVGDDFGAEHVELLRSRGVDVADIERVAGGKTFFWRGHYEADLNVAHTDETQLGVFADFEPKLSEGSRNADLLFLGNIQPELQRRVRDECSARLAALDSMNLWIETTRDPLLAAVGEVDCLMLN